MSAVYLLGVLWTQGKCCWCMSEVQKLLWEAMDFGEVSRISRETEYQNAHQHPKKEMEDLECKESVCVNSIKEGEEALYHHVHLWLDNADAIVPEVPRLINPSGQNFQDKN